MSKEEFLKIKTCVLKVNIHCDGCKNKVKKILQKIDGVYKTNIDSELGKVTISGNVDPETLIKKLRKSGKRAELWGAPKANNNQQNQLNNQLKNMQIDSGKGGNNKKGQGGGGQKDGGGGGGNNQQQPKGGAQIGQGMMNPLQLQQLKAMQDKLPQFKDLKMPPMPFGNNKDQNKKAVKFNIPEDDDLTGDEFDEYDDDEEDDFEDDDYEIDDDEMDDAPLNKMNPIMGNPQGMMPNMMMHGQPLMKGGNNNNNNGGGNGKKGGAGGGNIPVQMNLGGGGGGNNNGGKKDGNGNNNQNQGGGGGAAAQKGGQNGGGQPQNGGGGGGGGGGQNKNGHGGGGGNPNINANGAKKGGGMNNGLNGMPNMMAMNAAAGGGNVDPPKGNMPMGQMGQMMGNIPMGQMGNVAAAAAVQGLPAAAMNGANGGGYFQGAGPEMMPGNPYYQQQMAAMMMNQQRANGNERFQPMMYARPPPAVNYWPPHPYSYPYHAPPPPAEYYTNTFNDENTSSCSVM
ncbi:hypothetical protein ACH5RR_031243 [Cinchona calisaya]|uniref:HMA domain-containing protein n=1 Tax=Cinchona calisaya TaxID=153742 RepID=A0ABD2YG00_9GENT